MKTRYNNRLARQLILYIVLASTLITILTTAFQLYGMYSRDLSQIDQRLEEIRDVHLNNIAARLWIADMGELEKTLNNLLGLPDIEYLQVSEDGQMIMSVGTFKNKNVISRSYPLHYRFQGKDLVIGELLLHASLDNVYQRLLDQTLSILLSNGVKTFIVSIFMLFIFHHLVTRHLQRLSAFANKLDSANLDQELKLDRRTPPDKEPDELDNVVHALVSMQDKLKQSFDELKNSEQHYRSLIESSSAIPWEADADSFCFTYVGPQAQDILGYAPELWYEKDFWFSHIHQDDREYAGNYCQQAVRQCQDHEFEYRMIAADGREVWLRDVVQVIEEDGRPVRMQGFMFDISEQKQTARAYNASEQRFNTLVNISTVGVFRTDIEGNCLYVNQHWCELAGMEPQQAMGEGWAQAIHPDDRERVFDEWYRAARSGQTFRTECRFRRPDGRESWVLSLAAAERDGEGRVTGYIGTVTDISSQKKVENAIRYIARGTSADTGEAFYQQLVIHIAKLFEADFAMLALLDDESRDSVTTLAVSQRGELLNNLSYPLADTPCEHIITSRTCSFPSDVQKLFPHDTLLTEMGIDSYIGCPLTDMHGRIIGLIAVMHTEAMQLSDQATEILQIFATRASAEIARQQALLRLEQNRAQLEEQVNERTADLQAINRELESFSYSVSHDLRAPLRAIDGFSLALIEDYETQLDAAGRQFLQRIRYNTQHMNSLIESMLNLSRLGRKKLSLETIQLDALARQLLEQKLPLHEGRQIHYTVSDMPPVKADEKLLHIVMDNLIENALKYTQGTDPARIEIGLLQQDNDTVFFVRDNGAGFDMRFADKLFTAFQRLHGKEFEGTGIGLATVQRIIHRHGGRIWAEAEPGKGASFYFTLHGDNLA